MKRSSRLRFALLTLLLGGLAVEAVAGDGPAPAPAPSNTYGGGHSNAPVGDNIGSSVKSLTQRAETAISECGDSHCVADVLDNYAAALREIAPQLPPALQNLPDIVARAATRVRAAKSREEAVKAIKMAIVEVHKSIAFKADDLIALQVGTREGSFVAETLQVADSKLEKAVGL